AGTSSMLQRPWERRGVVDVREVGNLAAGHLEVARGSDLDRHPRSGDGRDLPDDTRLVAPLEAVDPLGHRFAGSHRAVLVPSVNAGHMSSDSTTDRGPPASSRRTAEPEEPKALTA